MSASAAATVVNAAQKASTFANNTVETARFEALKEPLGFIKILQFVLAIMAFAIAVNGSSSVSITVACDPSTVTPVPATTQSPGAMIFQASYSYPYDLMGTELKQARGCTNPKSLDQKYLATDNLNIISSAQFFVFTGVMAFLYSLVFIIIYVFFKHKYDNIIYLPLIDFAATCLFTLFWFAGSIAWAKAVGDIQNLTSPSTIIAAQVKACGKSTTTCEPNAYPGYGNIVVSCILGFGNLILWAGDCWFVLKETSWYKTRKQMQEHARNVTNNPISSSNINIQAQYNPNNKI